LEPVQKGKEVTGLWGQEVDSTRILSWPGDQQIT
jgi:hypothetical protein